MRSIDEVSASESAWMLTCSLPKWAAAAAATCLRSSSSIRSAAALSFVLSWISSSAATGALVGKGKAKATAEEEMAPTVTGKRKADASIADADDTTDDKRVRTAKEPTSVSGVKMGWKLRKKFPGHGPYSTVFASTLQIVCSPRFIFFLA